MYIHKAIHSAVVNFKLASGFLFCILICIYCRMELMCGHGFYRVKLHKSYVV